jgi:cyclin-dependent kinase 8/11
VPIRVDNKRGVAFLGGARGARGVRSGCGAEMYGGGGGPRKGGAPRIAEKYAPIGKIGEGTYGLVYKARHAAGGADGGLVAVKKFKSFKSMDGISPTAIREIKLLRELKNRYIVDLVDVMMDEVDKALYLVFDYAEHDLLEMIRWHHSRNNTSPMPMQTVKSLTYQILEGINHLHTNWIIHRDLKPSNILVTGVDKPPNERGCVKIADFGLARLFQSPLRPMSDVDAVVVTIWYRAPELLLGAKHYTKAIDLWAIGCIFAELITSKPLFQGVEKDRKGDDRNPFQADQVDKIFRVLGKPSPKIWPGVAELPNWTEAQNWQEYPRMLHKKIPELPADSAGYDLLSRLLDYNPVTRITASEALAHPFFTEEPRPQRVAFVDPLKDPYKCRPVTPLDPKKDMGWAMSNNGHPPAVAAAMAAVASSSSAASRGVGAHAGLTSAPPPSKRAKTLQR